MEQCKKCGGTGYIKNYAHIRGGVCFSCKGKYTKKEQPNKVDLNKPLILTWSFEGGIGYKRKKVGEIVKRREGTFKVTKIISDENNLGRITQKMEVVKVES